MVLCFLTHAEAAQAQPAGCADSSNTERHRIGAHREATNGISVARNKTERNIGDEHNAFGTAGGLLGVENPRTLRARLQREVAALHRITNDVVA